MPVSSSNNKYKAAGGFSADKKKMSGGASQKKMSGGAKTKKTQKTKKTPLKPNEGFCMMCYKRHGYKRVVMHDIKDMSKKTTKRTIKMRVGKCPENHKVYKIVGGG